MTDRRQPTSDQLLGAWFGEGPTIMPDRVIDHVAERIGRERQRRTWRLPWRPLMNGYAKFGLAAAAFIIVAVVGSSILSRIGPGPGGVPSPTPTLSPTTAPSPSTAAVRCEDDTTGCLGKLAGGTYTSTNFSPKVTYTIPAGPVDGPPAAYWTNTFDLDRALGLVPPTGNGRYSFQVFSDVAIPAQTHPDCSPQREPGVGNSPTDWALFLTKHPGFEASTPVPMDIGGFTGVRVDFGRAASWTARCADSSGPAILTILRGAGTAQPGVYWTENEQETFWILDVGGTTVLIALESVSNATQHAADVLSAQPIIDSFRFTP